MTNTVLGVIGGSGVYDIDGLSNRRWERVRHRATSLTRDRPELHLQLVEVVVARVLTAAARSYNRHGERGFPEAAFRWLLDWAGPVVRPELRELLWNNLGLTWR